MQNNHKCYCQYLGDQIALGYLISNLFSLISCGNFGNHTCLLGPTIYRMFLTLATLFSYSYKFIWNLVPRPHAKYRWVCSRNKAIARTTSFLRDFGRKSLPLCDIMKELQQRSMSLLAKDFISL